MSGFRHFKLDGCDCHPRSRSFTILSDTFGEFLEDLATLGVTPVSQAGRPYGLLKARTNDRWWIIPISGGRPSAAALAMLQPASLAAKLVKAGVAAAAWIGISFGWSAGRLNFGGLPNLPGAQPEGIAHCAYFTGTAGPHRKTAIQLMRDDGRILGYAKVSRRALVKPFLAREAEMLRRVGELALETADIPTVLAFDPGSDIRPAVLITDSRKTIGAKSPSNPVSAHHQFLRELAARTGSVGAGDAYEVVRRFSDDEHLPAEWVARLQAGLKTSAPLINRLPVALAHGDFTPWNSFVLERGLYVFDWEYAAENWPLGYDLVHYLLSSPRDEPASATIHKLNAEVAAVFLDGNIEMGRVCVLMSLLLHATFYMRRQIGCAGSIDGWTDASFRGGLIDASLDQWGAAR